MAEQQQPGLLANILAVAGFIILIVIIVWGAYNLLRLGGSGVSNFFSRFGGGDDIALTAPSQPVQSGRVFPLSWKYEPEEDGSYALLYQCRSGFRFEHQSPAGTKAIPCGNAYSVGSNTTLTLTPVLSGTSTAEVPLTIVFMPAATSSDERPQGTATINVISASSGSGTTQQPSGSGSASQNQNQPQKPGISDLSVRILAIGVIEPNGVFVARQPMHANEIAAVKFDIGNTGTLASGSYFFTVNLPMQPSYIYASPAQASLAPKAHVENILRFRPVAPGGGTITVTVDSTHAVVEGNEGNNVISQWFGASVYPYQYSAPYVY